MVGRPAEDMPQITSRICGVCPMAHHMAATKALDDLFGVVPTAAARAIRELAYLAFMLEDHALHFYFLGGPDFIVGPSAPASKRNILGVVDQLGAAAGRHIIAIRRRARDLVKLCGGKANHPVLGLPGGVAKPLRDHDRVQIGAFGADAIAFAESSLELFKQLVLGKPEHRNIMESDVYQQNTYYMGLVDTQDRVNFYDGALRVVDPDGREHLRFAPREYASHLAEHVEPWTYTKFVYLREPGWKGFSSGQQSGVYRVAPLARLNAASGMATPRSQNEYEQLYQLLGAKPCHHTLVNHWARLVEMLYAAERIAELARAPELTETDIRNMDLQTPREGIGVVEAPRGTLIHHFTSDARGVITGANLVVATVNNAAAISISIEQAARGLIRGGEPDDALLNMVEMAFRAYDPCMSCATHSLPGQMPLAIEIRAADGSIQRTLKRD